MSMRKVIRSMVTIYLVWQEVEILFWLCVVCAANRRRRCKKRGERGEESGHLERDQLGTQQVISVSHQLVTNDVLSWSLLFSVFVFSLPVNIHMVSYDTIRYHTQVCTVCKSFLRYLLFLILLCNKDYPFEFEFAPDEDNWALASALCRRERRVVVVVVVRLFFSARLS